LTESGSEYDQFHFEACLVDVSDRGKIELRGPDAAGFLHNLTTNDIRSLVAGSGCEIFLTTAKGKVVAFGWVYHLRSAEPTFWLDVDASAAQNASQHLNMYLISEQVEISDRTAEFAQLDLIGPKAREILAKLTGHEEAGWHDLECGIVQLNGSIDVQLRFHRRFGVDCFELVFPQERINEVRSKLTEAGAVPVAREALEILRIEAGIPAYGVDIDENVLAPEVGRTAQAISYGKGCYLGQETIVRIRDLGHVNRTLMGLKVLEGEAMPRGSKLLRESKEVGEVTSSVFSPRLRSLIGLAYVHRTCETPGTRVEVAVEAGRATAEVAALPFEFSGPS
jgi:tRNA-modifying protein YgfZ